MAAGALGYVIKQRMASELVAAIKERTIEIIASVLKANPKVKIAVVGHTEDKGEHDYNLDLSKDRADAVVVTLIGKHGIADDRLFVVCAKFLSPIASTDDEASRALNRRVELVRVH